MDYEGLRIGGQRDRQVEPIGGVVVMQAEPGGGCGKQGIGQGNHEHVLVRIETRHLAGWTGIGERDVHVCTLERLKKP